MTPLSPTALEEAAKAVEAKMEGPGSLSSTGAATAAITAYLAQREKEGFVEVRADVLAAIKSMLTIEAISPAEHGFEREKRREAWSKIEAMLAASQAWVPPFKVGDRVKHIGRNECGTVISTDDDVVDVEFDIQTPRGAISIGRFDERWFASHEGWLIAASQEQNDD